MKLLHVDSSIFGPESVSRALSERIVAAMRMRHPGIEVTYRDLASKPFGHLNATQFAALRGKLPETPTDDPDILAGNSAVEELLAADIVVIGAPMYNFTVPTQLKAWMDRLAMAGKTFRYTEKGPEGLLGGKKLIVASSQGGFYGAGKPLAVLEHQESYVRAFFGFLGVTDLTFIRAEGLQHSSYGREKALAAAEVEVAKLTA